MHDHDFELISAVAEGALAGEDLTAAEASIASCAECTTDLAMQRHAISALRGAPPAVMTHAERTHLHENLRRELGLVSQEPATSVRRRRFTWGVVAGWGTAAAVLLALVVITPSFLSTGSTDSAAGAATTVAAGELADEAQAETLQESLDQISIAAVPSDTITLDAPEAAGSAGTARDDGYVLPRIGDIDMDTAASRYAADGEFVYPTRGDEIDDVLVAKCVSRYVAEPFVTSEPVATGVLNGQEILLIAYTGAEGSMTLVAHDLSDCTVVESVNTANK